ncbi:MAG TPA: hypothetical protein P5084_12375 [Paludibacter sp.]|nr:hypothetical protein [Paludibacter sp.]
MTKADLLVKARIIKEETEEYANTSFRVGTMFEDVINYMSTLSGATINGKQKHFWRTTRPTADLVDPGDEWTSDVTLIKYTWNGYEFVNLND